MAVNWSDENLYNGRINMPKRVNDVDLALGSGLLNYGLQIFQQTLCSYFLLKGYITKSQAATFRKESIETAGDVRKSTFGPLFDKLRSEGTEFSKDVDVLDKVLKARNKYVHKLADMVSNDSFDLNASAEEIRDCINSVRKLNNRYQNIIAKLSKESNKSAGTAVKYTDEQMKVFIDDVIDDITDENGDFHWSDLGNALKKKGVSPEMYSGRLSDLYYRVYGFEEFDFDDEYDDSEDEYNGSYKDWFFN